MRRTDIPVRELILSGRAELILPDALLRGLDKLIDHAEFLTFSNDSFMLFAMAFQLTLQQWLVHMVHDKLTSLEKVYADRQI